ncbi:MAG: hypothetical protein Q6352_011955 [Candidatus Freyrarchaeum guaymaensis]
MVVRVRIRLRALKGSKGETVEGAGVLNAGYESERPEVIIPVRLAERLGLWPQLPEGTKVETYEVAGGTMVRVYFIGECFESEVVTEDGASSPVRTTGVIMEGQNEILLSDSLISAHRIVLEDAKSGLWRFRDEEKLRRSEPPQYWS